MLSDSLAVGVHHDGPGLRQVALEQSFATAPVRGYHGDGAADAVGPVQVPVDPVEGEAFRSIDVAADDCAVMSGVVGHVHLGSGESDDKR